MGPVLNLCCYRTQGLNFPFSWQASQSCLLEQLWVCDRIAELAMFVEAAREQVMQQTVLHLIQLGDQCLSLLDG